MSPAFTFFIGLLFLILFGWYFATDYGLRKRLIATLLAVLLVAFSIATIWPPEKNIALGLDIKGGTSFLIKLQQVDKDKPITPGLLDQAVEVIRKRVDYFGGGEPIISPVGQDRIRAAHPAMQRPSVRHCSGRHYPICAGHSRCHLWRRRGDHRSFCRKRSAWSRQCPGESVANASEHRRRTQRISDAWSRFDS